jgi:hypothetical protein
MNRQPLIYGIILLWTLTLIGCVTGSTPPSDTGPDTQAVQDTTGPDTQAVQDTTGPDDTPPAHSRTGNEKYDWTLPNDAPARHADCAAPDSNAYGPSYPWQGFTVSGTTYSCNRCPNGRKEIQGHWRAVFDDTDPTVLYEKDPTYRERVIFNGNQFSMRLNGQDLGQSVDATIEGWYFCGQKPEADNETVFFIVTSAAPDNAFAYETGYVFTSDLLTSDGGGGLLWAWYSGIVTVAGSSWGGTAPYCLIGTMVGDKPCVDPFATTE